MRTLRYFDSITGRLAFWFCLSAIVLTLVLSQLIGAAATSSMREQITSNLSEMASETTDKLDQGFFERYREVELLVKRRVMGDPTVALAEKQAEIDRIQETYPYYAWIGVTDLSGKVLVSTKSIIAGADVSARPWFRNAMNLTDSVGDVHEAKLLAKVLPAPVSGEPLRFLDIAFQYRDPDGAVAGVLGAHLSWEWAHEVERSVITATALKNQIEALIVGQDGTILLGPKNVVGTKLPPLWFDTAVQQGATATLLKGDDGKQYLVGASKVKGRGTFRGFGWTVLIRQDADQAFAPVRAIEQKVMASGFVIALLFSIFGVYNARRIARSLVDLANDVQRFQRGVTTTLSVPQKTYREMTELADAFGKLVNNLEQNEASLRTLNASLEDRVDQRTRDLANSEERVRRILENSHDAFIAIDGRGAVTDWNRQAEQTFGWTSAEAIGVALADLIVPERMREGHAQGFARFLKTGAGPIIGKRSELQSLHKDGHEIPIEISVVSLHDGQGFVAHAFLRDISERKAAEEKIRQSEKRLRAITDHLPVLISYIDHEERYRFANATHKEWLHLDPLSLLGRRVREVLDEKTYAQRKAMMDKALNGEEVVFETHSVIEGVDRYVHATYVPDIDSQGNTVGFYALNADISEVRTAEKKMAKLARHDTLTGLPNRYQLDESLNDALHRCRRSGQPMAVLFLDIDHFKRINDSLGHAAGDAVLNEFGRRLKESVRVTDTVGRLAGDEFIIILEGLHNPAEAESVATKILESVVAEMTIAGQAVCISTSIGIACSNGKNLSPKALMADADRALYKAKAKGRHQYFCEQPAA